VSEVPQTEAQIQHTITIIYMAGVNIQPESGYDDFLMRKSDALSVPTQTQVSGFGGTVADVPVKNEGAMDDVWVKNFIKSTNWKAKKVGFYIDGRTGYAEFANLRISQSISGLTLNAATITGGSITGSTITGATITGGTIILNNSSAGSGYLEWTGGSNIWEDGNGFLGFLANGSSTTQAGYYFYVGKGTGYSESSLAFAILRGTDGDVSQAGFFSGIHCIGNLNVDGGYTDPDGVHIKAAARIYNKVLFGPIISSTPDVRDSDNYISCEGTYPSGYMNYSSATKHVFDTPVQVMSYTTTNRDLIPSPVNGMIIYNTTTGALNAYVSGDWHAISYT
jgi:hypothetical protein